MSDDEIQNENPGGIGNRPDPRAASSVSEDLDYPRPLDGLPLEQRKRNLSALLSCCSGSFALLVVFVVSGQLLRYGPGGPVGWANEWALGIGSCFAVAAFLLAVPGFYRVATKPTAGGLFCSFIGIVTAALAVCIAACVEFLVSAFRGG